MSATPPNPPRAPALARIKPKPLPVLIGGDYEVMNFIENDPTGTGDAPRAAKLLLAKVAGVPALNHRWCAAVLGSPQKELITDRGRVFLKGNSGSIYIDLDHLELAMPEVRSCIDHAAAMRAMCMIARQAMLSANEELAAEGNGERVRVRLNNTDGEGNSYGTHLNLLVPRDAFRRMVAGGATSRFFASFCAATTLLGQGAVGSENGRPQTRYRWSQRADFFSRTHIIGEDTQAPNRVVWNTRDESHCENRELARLHCIFYDHNLCPVNAALKVWLLQAACAMEQARVTPVDLTVLEPLATGVRWSHDTALRQKTRLLMDDRQFTAAEWLAAFLDRLEPFLPELEGIVPDSPRMFALATEVVDALRRRDYEALFGRLDGFTKLAIIRKARNAHQLDWDSPHLKVIDQMYSSLDEDEGIFWRLEASDAIEQLFEPERVQHFMNHPPADTRAATRAKLLRLLPEENIHRVDWGEMSFELEGCPRRVLLTFDPLSSLVPGSPLDRATDASQLTEALNLLPESARESRPEAAAA